MNYKDNIYSFVKEHPGCSSYEIWEYLNSIVKERYDKKTKFGKLLADFPFGLGDEANLGRVFTTLDDLEEGGLIKSIKESTQSTLRSKRKFYPVEKQSNVRAIR